MKLELIAHVGRPEILRGMTIEVAQELYPDHEAVDNT
jgi:hypothetical protein